MCNVKGSAALFIVAAATIMILTGCETTKHAEVMSAEELAAQAQASATQGTGSGGDRGGIPLAGQGMSEGSLSVGDSSSTAAGTGSSELSLSSINPEGHPSPTLRDVSGASMDGGISGGGTDGGTQPSRSDLSDLTTEYPTGNRGPSASFGPESPPQAYLRDGTGTFVGGSMGEPMATADAGPHGYEGQQFVRALIPSDFVPESPPLPTNGSNGIGGGGGLGHVFFDFDQYVIRDDGVSTLQENAQLLSAKYQDSNVLIEGHCDERGTTDYNLVLGERRAQAVKDYLIDLGVASSRIKIVSYGKERPSCTGTEESCYQENRRGHVMLQ